VFQNTDKKNKETGSMGTDQNNKESGSQDTDKENKKSGPLGEDKKNKEADIERQARNRESSINIKTVCKNRADQWISPFKPQ